MKGYPVPRDTAERYFTVVRNEEDQYSVWPEGRPLPQGWQAQGMTGPRSECLDFIRREWTDPRPRTLREMAGY